MIVFVLLYFTSFFLRKISAVENDYVIFLPFKNLFFGKVRACLFHGFNVIFSVWNSIVYCVEGSQTFTLEQVVSPLLVQRIRIYLEFDLAVCLFIVVTTAHLPFSLSVPDLKAFYLLLIRKTFKTKKGNFYAKQ